MHILSRSDSIAGPIGSMAGLATSPDGQPMLPGSGMHRGSINGIPGGGLLGVTSRSPVKEPSFLARSASMEERDGESAENNNAGPGVMARSVSPPAKREGLPIRR